MPSPFQTLSQNPKITAENSKAIANAIDAIGRLGDPLLRPWVQQYVLQFPRIKAAITASSRSNAPLNQHQSYEGLFDACYRALSKLNETRSTAGLIQELKSVHPVLQFSAANVLAKRPNELQLHWQDAIDPLIFTLIEANIQNHLMGRLAVGDALSVIGEFAVPALRELLTEIEQDPLQFYLQKFCWQDLISSLAWILIAESFQTAGAFGAAFLAIKKQLPDSTLEELLEELDDAPISESINSVLEAISDVDPYADFPPEIVKEILEEEERRREENTSLYEIAFETIKALEQQESIPIDSDIRTFLENLPEEMPQKLETLLKYDVLLHKEELTPLIIEAWCWRLFRGPELTCSEKRVRAHSLALAIQLKTTELIPNLYAQINQTRPWFGCGFQAGLYRERQKCNEGGEMPQLTGWSVDQEQRHLLDIISRIGDRDALETLFEMLPASEGYQRERIINILGSLGELTYPHLIATLQHPDVQVRADAIQALGTMGLPRAVPHLLPFLQAPEENVVLSTLESLRWIGDPIAAEPVTQLASNSNQPSKIREAATRALFRLTII